MTAPKQRIPLIDGLRGLAVVMMLVHHFLIDLSWLAGVRNIPVINEPYFQWIQLFFLVLFFGVSGICTHFSHSNIRRGLIALAAGMAVTAVSFVVMPEAPIYFGVLHMLGSCMLIYGLCARWIDRIPTRTGFFLFLALFVINYAVYLNLPRVSVPHLYIFGILDYSFASSDYYPLFPWIFLFLAGAMLGRPIAEGRFPRWFYRARMPFFEMVGRHALVIYLAHQVVFYAAIQLVLLLLGRGV